MDNYVGNSKKLKSTIALVAVSVNRLNDHCERNGIRRDAYFVGATISVGFSFTCGHCEQNYWTVRETVPDCVIAPEVPVTVTVYVPSVVPELPPPPPPPPPPLPPLPHAEITPVKETSSTSIPSIICRVRRRVGMPRSRMHARAAPPADGQKNFLAGLRADVAAVVFTVRITVFAVEPLIVAEAGMVHVAGSLTAAGVMVQLNVIDPVNPFDGVKVIVDVFPVIAPGETVTGVPLTVKLGGRLTV